MVNDGSSFTKERQFPKFYNWAEFIERWEADRNEEEAIGLLHAGPQVPTHFLSSRERPAKAALERVEFYLHWADCAHEKIAETAQQVIVKKLLESRAILFLEETVPALLLLARFLREPRPTLKRPPYPRFASNYILRLFRAWCDPSGQDGTIHPALALQNATEDVIRPVLSWGYGWALWQLGQREDAVKVIEKFLEEHNYDWDTFVRRGQGDYAQDRLEDLSSEEIHYQLCARATWGLIQVNFQRFGSVTLVGQKKIPTPK